MTARQKLEKTQMLTCAKAIDFGGEETTGCYIAYERHDEHLRYSVP